MDSERFDALTRRLAARGSRRSLVTGLGSVLAVIGLRAQPGEAKGTCNGAGASCTRAGQCCPGLVCAPNGTCQNGMGLINSLNLPSTGGLLGSGGSGSCTIDANCPGEACCSGTCADKQTDPNNCGACGRVCPSGQSCCDGDCRGAAGGTCATDGDCCGGLTCCGGTCIDTTSDVNNCGGCGNVCSDPRGDPVCFLGYTGNGICGADCYSGSRVCITENGGIICCAKCCGRTGYQYCCPT